MKKFYFLFVFCKLILVTSFFASFASLNLTSCSCSDKNPDNSNQNPDESGGKADDTEQNPDEPDEKPDDAEQNQDEPDEKPYDSGQNPKPDGNKPNETDQQFNEKISKVWPNIEKEILKPENIDKMGKAIEEEFKKAK